jgi:hypothetical protein
LDQVIGHNRRFTIGYLVTMLFLDLAESPLPTTVAKRLEILFHDIGGHDSIHKELAETHELTVSLVDAATKNDKAFTH